MSKEHIIGEILKQMNPPPTKFHIDPDYSWESFKLPDGFEKPTKEAFETKFAELYALEPLRRLRMEREWRLMKCDYIFAGDYVSTLSEEKLNEWKVYRQALRDITIDAHPQLDETGMTLLGVEWPTTPN